MIKNGPKTGGGQTDMPPQITIGDQIVAGLLPPAMETLHTSIRHSPSPTQNVSSPGWNPGTPLTFAETLSM